MLTEEKDDIVFEKKYWTGEIRFVLLSTFTSIIKDAKSLKWYLWFFIFFVSLYFIFTTIYDVPDKKWGFPSYIISGKHKLYLSILYCLQAFVGIIGIYSLILLTYAKKSTWFWFLCSDLITMLSIIPLRLGAQVQAEFFMIPIHIFGLFYWNNRTKNLGEGLVVSKMKIWMVCIALILIFIFTFILYFETPALTSALTGNNYEWTNSQTFFQNTGYYWNKSWSIKLPRFFDALGGSLEIIGEITALLFFKENWLIWMVCNTVQIIIFSGIGGNVDLSMLVLWIFYQIYCMYGTWEWYKKSTKKVSTLFYSQSQLEFINNKKVII